MVASFGRNDELPTYRLPAQRLVSRSRQRVRRVLEFSDSGRHCSIYHIQLTARSSAVVSDNRNFPSCSIARLITRCVAGGNCGYCDNRCHPFQSKSRVRWDFPRNATPLDQACCWRRIALRRYDPGIDRGGGIPWARPAAFGSLGDLGACLGNHPIFPMGGARAGIVLRVVCNRNANPTWVCYQPRPQLGAPNVGRAWLTRSDTSRPVRRDLDIGVC